MSLAKVNLARCCKAHCSRSQSQTHLHDKKVWVVDVQLHRMEKVLHSAGLRNATVDEVLATATDDNLQTVAGGRGGRVAQAPAPNQRFMHAPAG
jgi:hypothetical protein